jgi:hypothetical protein
LANAAKNYFKIENKVEFEVYKKNPDSIYNKIIDEFLDPDTYKNNILGEYSKNYANYWLQNTNKEQTKETERIRFYLNKEQMDFYKKYIDLFNGYSNTDQFWIKENKNLFLLPEPIDNDIEEFKRVDRFLDNSWDRHGWSKSQVIIMPANDERIYIKYKIFFDEHYKDLIYKDNLIFIGTNYDMKFKVELPKFLEDIKNPNFDNKIKNYNQDGYSPTL